MKPTIKDVAERADVCIATVSRVINNHPNISNKTRKLVLDAMEDLNYTPYYRLASKSTKVVGVLVPDINNMYYPTVLKAIEKEFLKSNYNIFFCHTAENIDEEKRYLDTLLNKNVEGLIFFSARPKDSKNHYIEDISKRIPVLMINDYLSGSNVYSVMSDGVEGLYQATKYLIDLGHRKIGFINGNLNYSSYNDKLLGYKNALTDNEIEINDDYILFETPYTRGGYNGVKKLFKLREKPTAILTASDQIAIGAMKAIYEEGYLIPKDFSIIGYANIPIGEDIYPGLTTVNQFGEKIGKTAAQIIMGAINTDYVGPKKTLIHPELKIRNSCRVLT